MNNKGVWLILLVFFSGFANAELVYEGHLEPRETVVLRSPGVGVVRSLKVLLGKEVEKGTLLWTIDSPELLRSYREAEVAFLEAKQGQERFKKSEKLDPQIQPLLQHYRRSQSQYLRMKERSQKTCELYRAGVVSLDECRQEEQSTDDAEAWAMEAKQTLDAALQERNVSGKQTAMLQYENAKSAFEEKRALYRQLSLKAPVSGRLLAPPKQEGVATQIRVGDKVEENQVLAVLAPLNAYQVTLSVDEVDVSELSVEQSVNAELYALPGVTLSGKIRQIIHQANQAQEGALSRYQVIIDLDSPKENAANVHYGMQVKVEIP